MTAPLVVKVGGEAIDDPALRASVAEELAALQREGHPIVVVHGGGPQASRLAARLGIDSRVIAGRRITDLDTLQVMKMAVAGQAAVDLVAALRAAGARALATPGASAGLVDAVRRPPRVVAGGGEQPIDFGHVGDVLAIDTALLDDLLGAGLMPVVASLGADGAGAVYNINADIIATRVAAALRARLFLLTGAPGVLAEQTDPSTRIPALDAAAFRVAVADGTVQGGMLPKLEESFRMLATGDLPAVHVLHAGAGGIASELAVPGSVGTVLTA